MAKTAANSPKQGESGIKKLPAKIARTFKDMKGEVKKVVWPSKKQVLNNSIIVFIMLIISSIFIGGIDELLVLLLQLIFK